MMTYSNISIIFNPNSTGDSRGMATDLAKLLRKSTSLKVRCIPTKRAGHAEELAYSIAAKQTRPLIISSSGDGGYNEVVNGVMKSENPRAVCAVLPAGNANDHSRTLHSAPLDELIRKKRPRKIDVLRVEMDYRGNKQVRFAHSYVGLGLTPVIATELNRHTLNAFRELKIVLQRFYKYRPFRIKHNGKVRTLNSLIFANIHQMAKVLTLADDSKPDDGLFEVVTFPAGNKRQLLARLIKAAVSTLPTKRQQAAYEFETIKKMPMQLDGEVVSLAAGTVVTVRCVHLALNTLY